MCTKYARLCAASIVLALLSLNCGGGSSMTNTSSNAPGATPPPSSSSSGSGSSSPGGSSSGGSGSSGGGSSTNLLPPKFLYVANEARNAAGSYGISGYSVDVNTGGLSPISGSLFSIQSSPHWVAVNPSGSYLYASSTFGNSSALTTYSIDRNTGALAMVGTLDAMGNLFAIPKVDPSGEFLLLAGSSNVSVYKLNATAGLPTLIGTSPAGNGPWSITTDRQSRFVYVAGDGTTVVGYAFDKNTGALTQVPGSPYTVRSRAAIPGNEGTPLICVLRPSADFLYVDDSLNDTIEAFAVDQTAGSLTPLSGSPFPSKGKDLSVAMDPLGRYLFTGNSFLASISVFSISNSGTLMPVPGSPFMTPFVTQNSPGGGLFVAADPSGHFLYAAAGDHNQIIGYSIDQSTGSLTQIPGTPLPTGNHPFGLVVSP